MFKLKLITALSVLLLLGGCAQTPIENGPVTITPPANSGTPSAGTASPSPVNSGTPTPSPSPEVKDFLIELEGTQEKMTLTKYAADAFSIYYDATKFTVKTDQPGETGFYLTNPDPNIYPDVSMTIGFEKGATAKAQADQLQKASANTKLPYKLVGSEKIGELTAQHLHAIAGSKWNSQVSDVYLVDGTDGCYTITVGCYLEASEGWGARLGVMVKTFEMK